MDVFDPNILQRVFLEAILQVGIKKSIGDLGPECPFNNHPKIHHEVFVYAGSSILSYLPILCCLTTVVCYMSYCMEICVIVLAVRFLHFTIIVH